MKRILKPLFFLIFVLSIAESNAQMDLAVTSYNLHTIAINTSQDKTISGELRTTAAPTQIRDLQTEIDVFYNFKTKPYHRFSVGLGFNVMLFSEFDFFHAIAIPGQLEIFPIQDKRQFSILYEVAPLIHTDGDNALRHLMGFRYTFGERF